ncbi:MAG: CCA tRNA nucleotidyltransferase [Prochloraceae cyanobacterium]
MFWREKYPAISPQNYPFSLDFLPKTAYLVGGALRDALLLRKREYLDLDFVVFEGAIAIARKIAKYYRAGFVVLDKEREIARVVFDRATVDIALAEGNKVETDLRRRDFTINVIAYNPHNDELFDPLGGKSDLDSKIIKMVSKSNLEDDPLRLLRAYRQAAQLNFTIEPVTKSTIRDLSAFISSIAAERVRSELNYLLADSNGNNWLQGAIAAGLLKPWLKQIEAENLEILSKIDRAIEQLKDIEGFSGNLALAKLACLVSRVPQTAELELIDLKYSRAEIRTVTTALRSLPRLEGLTAPMSLKEQYFFFLDVGDVFEIVAVLAIAKQVDRNFIYSLIKRYLDPQDPIAHPQPLITGKDLIRVLKIKPSPKIGLLLSEIQIALIEGKISNSEEALKLAKKIYLEIEKNPQ